MAQYWEDQRNIDSLLGNVQEQHNADEVSVQHGAAASSIQEAVNSHAAQQPLHSKLVDNQHVVAPQQVLEYADHHGSNVTRNQVAVNETSTNPLSNLVNYSSSDDEA